ncbi:MAG: VWA domain-containing protein [Planctomycetota bacterium]
MMLAYPWILIVLPLPIVLRYLLPPFRQQRASIRVPLFDVVAEASGQTASQGAIIRRRSIVQTLVFVLCWVFMVVALARPQYLLPAVKKQIPSRDLMLAIDLSGSMDTQDFQNVAGKTVNRLEAVKEVLDEFLMRRDGDRVGMIVFGTGAFVQIPFTQDLEVCRQLLQQIDVRMAGPQTSLGDAIGLAITVFDRSELDDKVLIALTDGNDTGSRVPPVEASKIASDNGIVIHTIGVGDPEAAGEELLDEETLRKVAEQTGGQYFFAAERDSLSGIYRMLDQMSQREIDQVSYRPRQELFHWFVFAALVVSITYFVIAETLLATRLRLTPKASSISVADGEEKAA